MKDIGKKILGALALAACCTSVLAFAGCKEEMYTGKPLDGYVSTTDDAESNGGFAVKKGDYVYFINGSQDWSASNNYGSVVKGALMRIHEDDLAAGDYSKTDMVVPMLFSQSNTDSGIFIYGDYVYYATPTTDKDVNSGEVSNSWIDFKRAKLDGSEAMGSYYFRSDKNSTKFRFVEENGTVYCLYEKDGALISFNTNTRSHTTLVEGAGSYYFNEKDKSDGTVYYTMNVPIDEAANESYNQIFCVSPSASVTAYNGNSYTTSAGKTYDFSDFDMKDVAGFDAGNYTTYPYVNLGTLVLDGVGQNTNGTKFSWDDTSSATTIGGYKYTIQRAENGGVYYTKTEAEGTTGSPNGTDASLYYVATDDVLDTTTDWDTVDGNDQATRVAYTTTNANESALIEIIDGKHYYFYTADSKLYKGFINGNDDDKIDFYASVSSPTLWKVDGNYLYYFQSATNGNGLSRINYTGAQTDYTNALVESDKATAYDEYKAWTMNGVDWNSSWFVPEMFDGTFMYASAQSFGSVSYDYIYGVQVGTTAQIKARNEKYDAVWEAIDDEEIDNEALSSLKEYYYRGGDMAVYETAKENELYDDVQMDEFDKFTARFASDYTGADKLYFETEFFAHIGKMMDSEVEEMNEALEELVLSEEETTTAADKGLPTWAIVLIVVGGVLVVAAGVLIPLLIVLSKKKKERARREATVNAYKRKRIDTTDDKTIDVYADEMQENEPTEEQSVSEEPTATEEEKEE